MYVLLNKQENIKITYFSENSNLLSHLKIGDRLYVVGFGKVKQVLSCLHLIKDNKSRDCNYIDMSTNDGFKTGTVNYNINKMASLKVLHSENINVYEVFGTVSGRTYVFVHDLWLFTKDEKENLVVYKENDKILVADSIYKLAKGENNDENN